MILTNYYKKNPARNTDLCQRNQNLFKSIIMNAFQKTGEKMTNYRWTICAMLFFATTVNYLDRQVLSLTWDEFIKPEFHWDESHYGTITSVFLYCLRNMYALCRSLCGLDGNEERIPLGYRRMVCRCLSARSLWYCNRSAGRTAQCCRTCRSHRRRGGNHRYCQYVLLPGCTLYTCSRRSR